MRTPTPIEQRLLKTQQELQDCPHLAVDRSSTGELGQIFDLIPSGWPGAELCSELRVIDNTPLTAAGQLAAIRIQRHTDPLEIWYYDMDMNEVEGWGQQLVRLDLTYTGYLEQLVLTKGTYGWQYLFTDELPFTDPYFKNFRTGLGAMLDHFPGLFPAWDYTDLRRRFAARFD
ncbi:hypothetical protein ACQUSR_00305 [Streptomyces sp. P1-3]|uniref:hypothetical protein n=1 Tax=Streptomyces sp. P1-3 TaxID=3421658 RepID=UPI003D36CC73